MTVQGRIKLLIVYWEMHLILDYIVLTQLLILSTESAINLILKWLQVSNSGMNFGFGITYGNQFNFDNGNSIGVLGSLSQNEQPFMKTLKIISIILALIKVY